MWRCGSAGSLKGVSTLVTLPRIVTSYRDSVDGTRVTYQKLVTRSRYEFVRLAVGIWPSHQRDDTVTAGAVLDVQRDTSPPSAASCKDIPRTPVTNWEPQGVRLAGHGQAVRHGMEVQLVNAYRVSHLQRDSVLHYAVTLQVWTHLKTT